MSENVENLILERLRRIDDRLGNIEGDVKNIKLRMTAAEEHLLSIQTSVLAFGKCGR